MGLKELLEEQGLRNTQKYQAAADLYVSDLPDRFKEFANSILPLDIDRVKMVNVEQY